MISDLVLGKVQVFTSSNGGFRPDHHAERMVEKLIKVSDNVPDPIRQQALAFRDAIKELAGRTIITAIKDDRATLAFKLREAGMPEAASFIEKEPI